MKSLKSCRQDFPALSRKHNNRNLIYLDGPGGSQVSTSVIEAVSGYYKTSNSNTHGAFITTIETDNIIEQARERMAAFLGAVGPETISFGQNMTTLNFSISKALARFLEPESEILITQLDHEANRGPWLRLVDNGFKIKEVKIKTEGTLDYEDFESKLTSRTSLVAVGYASNALGTVNDLKKIRTLTQTHNALLLVDAVHYAPHFKIDVQKMDCDFLMCSAYKFYGPHVGILYTRPGLLNRLDTDRLSTQEAEAPFRIETGTLNHAALAGVTAAVEYLASFGEGSDIGSQLADSFSSIQIHEHDLLKQLFQGLNQIPGLTIIGPDPDPQWHTPTLSFTLQGYNPNQVCEFMAAKNICAWDGHFYAQRAIEVLGLLSEGGVTRLGISMYTTEEDIEYTINTIKGLVLQTDIMI